jgi:hypothetical protein
MTSYLPILIPFGLALFVLRSQLLRVAIHETGGENMHRSVQIGVMSGWISLLGALALIAGSFLVSGLWRGLAGIVVGLGLGILISAFLLPMIGSTLALGHLGGEGNKSIAEFNRRFGHIIAFGVGWIALICLYSIYFSGV